MTEMGISPLAVDELCAFLKREGLPAYARMVRDLQRRVAQKPSVHISGRHPLSSEGEAAVADIVRAAREVDAGSGVILLTDMFGGTPSNLAISVMDETKAEVIAGLNLPMLIKLASLRGREPLGACVAAAQDAGRKYISVASYVLAGEK